MIWATCLVEKVSIIWLWSFLKTKERNILHKEFPVQNQKLSKKICRIRGAPIGSATNELAKERAQDTESTRDHRLHHACAAEWNMACGASRALAAAKLSTNWRASSLHLPPVREQPQRGGCLERFRKHQRLCPQVAKRQGKSHLDTDGVVLVCGDGGNDAGALKQAEVGLALFAGQGATNTEEPVQSVGKGDSEKMLNERQLEITKRAKDVQKLRAQFIKDKRKELQQEQMAWQVLRGIILNHCTPTPHRSETHGIAERAARRVKEGTSAVLLQSGLGVIAICEIFRIFYLMMMNHHMKGGSETSDTVWSNCRISPYFCERPI